ncbi:DUF3703 domain-containing protein [Aurantiacibacter sediminis]|uniref:DUF3703 domain-containing protein n=1 Tax=Aurantiacibacter sediminis TaxID=2793064 RepID=A0ABS0N2J3_9SPHN|nr:DUF3703 domain-containing protein [Aurantiacibacter sediminis]MBH5321520.1 DUF3703 domain-containing protein [Aurantiacibacter sediminis]
MKKADSLSLSDHVRLELDLAHRKVKPASSFRHLERAHVLSQYSTKDHTAVHFAMLRWAWQQRDWREGTGQIVRLIGAMTKTAFGLIPAGNTGGSNVSPIKPMPIPDDLAAIIASCRL